MSLLDRIEPLMGAEAARVIALVTDTAREQNVRVLLVGGLVRDLLSERPNTDIDFTIEGDAIGFAQTLASKYGGEIVTHPPFGTATWWFNDRAIDFAMTRGETYARPGALPTVQPAPLEVDLKRRDFTINAMALELGPTTGTLVDPFGGQAALDAKVLRVLHDQSFIDDPTRILRGLRFAHRLGMTFDANTGKLLSAALPMLDAVTGERIQNELTLMMLEPDPAAGWRLMAAWGVMSVIHPAFEPPQDIDYRWSRVRRSWYPGLDHDSTLADHFWLLLLCAYPTDIIASISVRLLLSKSLIEDAIAASRLIHDVPPFSPDAPASVKTRVLSKYSNRALDTPLKFLRNDLGDSITSYATEWRHIRPRTDGRALIERGLIPGPCFKRIIDHLTDARIDGIIQSDDEEIRHLDHLIASNFCNEKSN